MTRSQSHSRRRTIIRVSIWTVALLMLTNVFWAVWGSCDIDHPSILNQNVRLGTTAYSESSGVVVREERLADAGVVVPQLRVPRDDDVSWRAKDDAGH